MQEISELIENPTLELSELVIQSIDRVKQRGDIFVLKGDGERDAKGYTVFITRPSTGSDMIRCDSDDLRNAIIDVLRRYVGNSVETE
ncbi:MAG: hypothetical protein Aurels2KO_15010 [Aureliella sp.]